MTFEPGQVMGRYRIDEKVGTGVFMTEYLATDLNDFETAVVVKVVGQRHLGDEGAGDRFVDVARAMQAANSRDLGQIVDVGTTEEGQPFIVRAPHDRGTLHDRLKLGRPANDDDLRRIVAFLGRALTALQKAGVAHGNLRPTNVLITSGEPEPDVTFGLLWEDDQLVLGDPAPNEARVDSGTLDTRPSDLSAASQLVAEASLGRGRREGESWSDLLVAISAAGRFELAAALGKAATLDASSDGQSAVATWADVVGAPFVPAATRTRRTAHRHRTKASSKAGSSKARSSKAGSSKAGSSKVVVYGSVVAAVVIALGGVWFGQTRESAPAAQAFAETATPVPTATPAPTATPTPRSDLGEAKATECLDQGSGNDVVDFGLAEVGHDEILVEWQALDAKVALRVNGTPIGQVEPEASEFKIERLRPDTLYVIHAELARGSTESSVVCAQTFPGPTPAPDPSLAEPAFGSKVIVID